jgi:excinuclease ABC subunit A
VEKLLEVLQRLVDQGNTVLVIEHNLDVIKCADWLIDLGPEGGDAGGELIAQGTPEEICAHPNSETGKVLRRVLPWCGPARHAETSDDEDSAAETTQQAEGGLKAPVGAKTRGRAPAKRRTAS